MNRLLLCAIAILMTTACSRHEATTLAATGAHQPATVVEVETVAASPITDLYRASAIVLVERPLSDQFVRPAVSGELESRLHVIKQEILSRDRLTELINRFHLYPEMRR